MLIRPEHTATTTTRAATTSGETAKTKRMKERKKTKAAKQVNYSTAGRVFAHFPRFLLCKFQAREMFPFILSLYLLMGRSCSAIRYGQKKTMKKVKLIAFA